VSTESTTAGAGTTRSVEDVFRGTMAAFERQDAEGILSHYPEDDDFTYVDMTNPEVLVRGRDGMRAWLAEFWSVVDMTGAEMKVLSTMSEGDRVAGEIELHATYVGEGAPPDGARVVMPACVVQRIVDGVIREERLYIDSNAIPRQLEELA
jgi:hypothetical protein